MFANLRSVPPAEPSNQRITAIDQFGRPPRHQLVDGRSIFRLFDESLEQARGLSHAIDFLIERTDVTRKNRLPELANVRHVGEHEEMSLSQRIAANCAEQVRLAGPAL